ncbi:hypothetical protein AC579_5874 [Pseudocercospora musae]|uniref:Uncharacterized protein n=1 Tax=Pseudocercospora musae TaxID=113226 RepID=A0A139HXH5_9PEZI|nr:hypothetical protein AC579_5874 [Pseudocercospora musae]
MPPKKRGRKPRAKPATPKPATPPPTPPPLPLVLTNLERACEASSQLDSTISARQYAQSRLFRAEVEHRELGRVIERGAGMQSIPAADYRREEVTGKYLEEVRSRLPVAKSEERAAIKKVSELYEALSSEEKQEYDKTKAQERRVEAENAASQAQIAQDQRHQSERVQVEVWYQSTEIGFKNYSQIKVFPMPPALYHCDKEYCRRSVYAAKKFALGMCPCDVKEVFRIYSTYHQDFDPNKEKKRWHPDGFSGCQDKRMQEMAKEIFVVLGEMQAKR